MNQAEQRFIESGLVPKVRHFVAKSIWRYQKSSTLINQFLFTLTVAGIYMRYFPYVPSEQKAFYVFLIYFVSFFGVFFLGWLYDNVWHLWKEEAVVMVERDQFQDIEFTEKDKVLLELDLVQNKTMYEAMRTNMLICDHYGLSYGNLQEKLEELDFHIAALKEWIEHGRIINKI